MTTDHRKKANKKRNGRTRYEKGRAAHDRHPPKKFKGKRGSTTHAPKPAESATLADVWPELF